MRAEVPRSEQPEVYYVEPGYILSPAAREYLMGRQIKISSGPKPGSEPESVTAAAEVPQAFPWNPWALRSDAKITKPTQALCLADPQTPAQRGQ